jgi:5-formyltetrahydrofolate cyclo-ligase
MLKAASCDAPSGPRHALRKRLLEQREQFAAGPHADAAAVALGRHLVGVLLALEPQRLGVYWPHRSEFNAVPAIRADSTLAKLPNAAALALPYAQRAPVRMHYRAWDGEAPPLVDECGIAASAGVPVVPDVVLVPCVGYTSAGFRLGYGGGYFDRWLAQHRDVTAVGVAWACAQIDAETFAAQPHDLPLSLIVTQHGAV